jgi:predicted RNA-binding Zn ribbon-like protein
MNQSRPQSIVELRLLGGRIALDFANTMEPRFGPRRRNYLLSVIDLIRWARHAGIVDRAQASPAPRRYQRQDTFERRTLTRALRLREAIFNVFSHTAKGTSVPSRDLEVLRSEYLLGLSEAALRLHDVHFEWTSRQDTSVKQVLWAVARDAIDLLTSPLLGRVRVCPGLQDCGWLFLDQSKNASRRWCSMEGCGNRSKTSRHAPKAGRRKSARRLI